MVGKLNNSKTAASYYQKFGSRLGYLLVMRRSQHFGYYDNLHPIEDLAQDNYHSKFIKLLSLHPGMKVLDAGCGQGVVATEIAKNNNVEVVGITITPHEVKNATRRASKAGVLSKTSFFVQDYATTNFEDNSFDRIYTTESLSHARNVKQVLSESYGYIREYEFMFGNFFTRKDVTEKNLVTVLGHSLANDVFEDVNPVGKQINLSGTDYRVVGVLAETEPSQFDNPNVVAFVPHTVVVDKNGTSKNYGSIIVKAVDEASVEQVKTHVEEILLAKHGYANTDEADFTIKSSAEVLSSITGLTDLFRKVLMISAAVSLLVGGIGIMNIMLVSVTERTREIGLRKAVGAKTRHIMMQFLAEAIVLTIIGGILGIALGFIMASGLTKALDLDIVPSISVETIVVTAGISIGVGLLFGTYPAYKAAKLDPIDALRYE